MPTLHLNPLDLAIIAAYFVAILVIGLRVRRRTRTSNEFFQAGRSLPAIVTGIAFVAANSGALEIMGVVSTSAKYGARANQFYWTGAIPAMLFLGLLMMPVYHRSKARSVPEFLKLRYNEQTRAFNAVCFAVMMVLVSGISLYAMAIVLRSFLGWSFLGSTLVAASVVLVYVALGGLTATIYNEVLQFGLIVLGFAPMVFFVLRDFHGLGGLQASLAPSMRHTWQGLSLADPFHSPMDVMGAIFGLSFVLSFGYWCTDFLLVQRALAARDLHAARMTPLIGSVAKLFFPLLVVVPGLAATVLFPRSLANHYDLALPALMQRYYGHGLLGLGIVAMLASFMSGMAGNITAFNTVWTYDIYQAYIAPKKTDRHYLRVGRLATVVATACSVGTAFIVLRFNNLMDYVQLLFSFFNAPLLATLLLGMFTKWATPAGGFWGLLVGTLASMLHRGAYSAGILPYASDMTASFYGAIAGFSVCLLVTVLVSLCTTDCSSEQLQGVLYQPSSGRYGENGTGRRGRQGVWLLALAVTVACVLLNVWFR